MPNSNNNFENNGGIVLLDTKQLKAFLHIKGDATLWRYLKEGKIPQPTLTISRSMRLWDKNELLAHLTAKSQENTQGGEL